MTRNMGSLDRGIRLVLGLGMLGAGLYFESWLGLIGLVPMATAAVGWCPAYLPFGLSTCRVESSGGAA